MSTEIVHLTTLTTLECCSCGMAMGLSKSWVENARRIGHFKNQFYCPYCGNHQGWGTSRHEREIAEMREQCNRLSEQAARAEARKKEAIAEADHFRKSRDGVRGALSKVKKRVGKGVCPCCNRHFGNLHRHMESKHPEFSTSETAPSTLPAKK